MCRLVLEIVFGGSIEVGMYIVGYERSIGGSIECGIRFCISGSIGGSIRGSIVNSSGCSIWSIIGSNIGVFMVAGSEEKMEVVSEENGGIGFSFKGGFRGSIVGSSGDSLRGTGEDVEGKMGQV